MEDNITFETLLLQKELHVDIIQCMKELYEIEKEERKLLVAKEQMSRMSLAD